MVPALALTVARVSGPGERLATIGGMLAMAAMAAGSLTYTFFFTSYALTSPDVDARLDDLGSAYGALGPVLTSFFVVYLAGSLIGSSSWRSASSVLGALLGGQQSHWH